MSELMTQAAAAAPATEAATSRQTKSFTAKQVKLLFGPSTSGKSYIMIDGQNLYMVNQATFNDVTAGNIASLIFEKSDEPMPKRPQDPPDAASMYSWKPIDVNETLAAKYEAEARDVNAEANLADAKIKLKKVAQQLKDEA